MLLLAFLAVGSALATAVCWKYKYFNFQMYNDEMPSLDNTITEIPVDPPPAPTPAERLYATSKAAIGQDVTPKDIVPDYVACVSSLQEIYYRTFGHYIGSGAALYNTYALWFELRQNPAFEAVLVPTPGCIAVCATGTSQNDEAPIPHGHCAVVGKVNWMSNTSFGPKAGQWDANYTRESWDDYFFHKGGYPVYFFKPV